MTPDEYALFSSLENDISADLHSVPVPRYYAVKALFTSDQYPDNFEARILPGTMDISRSEADRSILFFRQGRTEDVAQALTMMFEDLALSQDRLWRLWAVCVVAIQTEVLDR